jgi:hypothetical protein
MTIGRSSSVATMVAATLFVVACGSDSSNKGTGSSVPAPTTPVATTAATTPAPATTTATTEVSAAGDTMALGTRVVAPYVVYGKSGAGQNTTVGVNVLHIRKGKISDFKDFNLDTKQKQTVPYFVDVKYENLGKLKLQRFLLEPSIEDSDGQEYKGLNLIILSGTFKKCPQPSRKRLAPGEKFTLCTPFLLPKGKTFERVRFAGDVTKDPYFWK